MARRSTRPFVFLNVAVTADGKIASENHQVTTFGSPADLHHLYELRSTADAIICGARTVEATQATLGNGSEAFRRRRLRHGLSEYPLRIIVSGSGSISSDAAIWSQRFSPILVLTTERSRREWKRLRGLANDVWSLGRSTIDFTKALERLHQEHGVRRLLCEGGGELNEALIHAGLVDELHITFCPLLLAGRRAPTLADGPGIPVLADAARFRLKRRRVVGSELFSVYSAVRPAH
jgi:riboflavin-specific deaminase-like protein